MSPEWTAPDSDGWNDADSPYQDWWFNKEINDSKRGGKSAGDIFKHVFTPTVLPPPKEESQGRLRLYMPDGTENPSDKLPERWELSQVEEELGKIEPPPKETVIVGIVDTGIALGHRRFRRQNGQTRFLAAWQQSAKFNEQSSLPFGQELYANRIDDLLKKHSGGDLMGDLDEDAFNREACLVAPKSVLGNRSLDYRAAHGTHVLDLATGFDPRKADDTQLELTRIIAVNLPSRRVHGTAGNFLAFFARNAVERILFLADALWTVHHPKDPHGGFPVVINFSYGMLAGPKDGSSTWELEIRDLVHHRNVLRGIPTRVVMPAGNSNLSRGNARKLIGTEGPAVRRPDDPKPYHVDPVLSIPWRIHPSDHTSNFVEIWAKARDRHTGEDVAEVSAKKFQLWVTPPGLENELPVPKLEPGQYSDLENYARVYCYRPKGQERAPKEQRRAHFVICTAPTISYDSAKPEAPAGLWKISLRYPGEENTGNENTENTENTDIVQEVTFTVQSDQSDLQHAVIGRQSYFDQSNYRTHTEDGRVVDSYAPGKDRYRSGGNRESWAQHGPVQRKGTQNALATCDEFIVIGGYRTGDLAPALYSSTFDGDSKRGRGREVPSVLYPSDDGIAHFGMLAAGSRDGSVVALRGTSMASALATRDIADQLAKGNRYPHREFPADEQWLRSCADEFRHLSPRMKRYNALKQGAGPVPSPDTGRVPRFGGS